MQKIKLFMVLALLVVGVSGAWAATQKFTVTYVGQTVAQGAGYTANTNRNITFSYYRYNLTAGRIQTGYTATEFTVSGDYANYPSYYTNQLQNYITPTPIDDFNSAVTVSGTTVTITYTPKPENVLTWSEGDFTYSTYHIQQTGNQGYMDKTFDYYPGQPEVAISLNMNTSGTLEEVVCIRLYRIYTGGWNNRYVYFNEDGNEVDNSVPTIDGTVLPSTTNQPVIVNGTTYTYLGAYDYHGENWINTGNTVTVDYQQYEYSVRYFYYKRSFAGNYSTKTSVVIPKEVEHNGVTYKVTAIQKWGFCYEANDVNIRPFCSSYETKDGRKTYTDKPGSEEVNFNDHRNDYLKTVSFESFSNIHSIGDYAFMSCKQLTSIQIPASVTYFGQGIFECCRALTDVRFQTLTAPMITYYNGLETAASTTDDTVIPLTDAMIDKVRWTELRNFTFWFCTALESLEWPDGITKSDGQGYGASMQYMTSLKNVRLPNTLTTIGPHFLCCAMSLETLTIPASVTNIDGACFHGCESLKSVYLLGPASALKTGTGTAGEDTFGQNDLFCAEHVSDATFYCVEKYLSDYQNDDGWKLIDEHGIYDASAPTYGNTLTTIPIENRVFPAKWV
ncbi:MAG: leucine-rich repeat domain-containing protein, partial [Bacteroidaceae bacterium]|nr:leucine-rich repeat domain-containing protein [Bacteroidaceae bacterium]